MTKIVLDCQKCGGSLEITDAMEIFRCQYCGMPYLVDRSDGRIRITQLEERVSKVEDEQAQMRTDLVEAKIFQVRKSIEGIFRKLETIDGGKQRAYFQASHIEDLYTEEWELRQEYIEKGGEKAEIVGFINPVEVFPMVREVLPRVKLRVGYGYKLSLSDHYYYPTVEKYAFMAGAQTLAKFPRDEIKLSWYLGRSFKEKFTAILQERYPGIQIR
jgi:hypothetical protein